MWQGIQGGWATIPKSESADHTLVCKACWKSFVPGSHCQIETEMAMGGVGRQGETCPTTNGGGKGGLVRVAFSTMSYVWHNADAGEQKQSRVRKPSATIRRLCCFGRVQANNNLQHTMQWGINNPNEKRPNNLLRNFRRCFQASLCCNATSMKPALPRKGAHGGRKNKTPYQSES